MIMFWLTMREFGFISVSSAWINVRISNWFSLYCVFQLFFVAGFIVMFQGISLTVTDDVLLLTVSAYHSTSVCSASVNVPASNWVAVDRVFQMTFVSSFLTSVGISLTHSGKILQLNVRAFRCTSDNIVWVNVPASDCLTVDWVIRCDFWFQFRDVYRNLSDEQWWCFSWLCVNSVSILFQVRGSLCLHQIDFLWIVSLVIFVSSFVVSVGICLTNNDGFSHLIVHFFPVQFVALQSMSLHQIDFLWIVSVW